MKAVVVIPARYDSTRLPGKVLLRETGKFLIQHVWERASKARLIDEVIIATDDERVAEASCSFGVTAVMTSREHETGTDRIAEVAGGIDADIIINVQGDEPDIAPGMIDQLVEILREAEAPMATLAAPIGSDEELSDPNVVKVVLDSGGFALYFSRAAIPYVRDRGASDDEGGVSGVDRGPASVERRPSGGDRGPATVNREAADGEREAADGDRLSAGDHGQATVERKPVTFLRHIGIYGYKRDFLLKYPGLARGPLEKLEKLEQLRALENGFKIKVGLTQYVPAGVDTREQYEAFKSRYEAKKKKG